MDMSNIAHRLELKFGLGTRPELRRRLYEDLESMVLEAPEGNAQKAYQIIASAASDSEGKDDPGRYFAYVVKLRLQERGIGKEPVI